MMYDLLTDEMFWFGSFLWLAGVIVLVWLSWVPAARSLPEPPDTHVGTNEDPEVTVEMLREMAAQMHIRDDLTGGELRADTDWSALFDTMELQILETLDTAVEAAELRHAVACDTAEMHYRAKLAAMLADDLPTAEWTPEAIGLRAAGRPR